jgi:hypothetical protein
MHELLARLVGGDEAAIPTIVSASRTSADPLILAAAALFADDGEALLTRARAAAAAMPDRQVVAIAAAYRDGERERVEALAREHLVDHPHDVLVAWIADVNRNPKEGT